MKPHFKLIPFFMLAVVLFTIATAALADTSRSTRNFVLKAAIGNQFEILSSQLALTKTQNASVKQFAQQMIGDHTKAADQLNATLASENMSNLAGNNLDKEYLKILNDLKDTSDNTTFDKKYIKAQVQAHDDAVKLFQDYARKGDNAALRDFATQTVPTLQQHQQMAHTLKVGQ